MANTRQNLLQEFERQLSLLRPAVRDQYIQAHAKCCLARGKLPTPEEIQQLLCLWKVTLEMGTEFAASKGMVSVSAVLRQRS